MYNPTTRLLTILELLQAHRVMSGNTLAQRLEVEPRSVRRYITMLQDMGMPIEAVHGPGGGYQLRPGFKLPPLMFHEEEATAIVLGLLSSSRQTLEQSSTAIEGALAKVLRVLPIRARERIDAVMSNLVFSDSSSWERVNAAMLLDLSEAVQQQQRISIQYQSHQDHYTERMVEPYGLASWWGQWYVVGYCLLRKGFRTFRLDRVRNLKVLPDTFMREPDFDVAQYMRETIGKQTNRFQIKVLFHAPLFTVQQKIPAAFGTLTETEHGILFETSHGAVSDVARFLATRELPFRVLEPQELRDEVRRLAESLLHSINE